MGAVHSKEKNAKWGEHRGGVDEFIAHVSATVDRLRREQVSSARIMLTIGEQYANIRLSDVGRPLQFLRQMAGAPPLAFGVVGFRAELVDDNHPARHYTAFLFLGYWLPAWLAVLVLWLWEAAGFVRYRGHWSQNDIHSGYVGIRHGGLVRRYGPAILPALIARDVACAREAIVT